MVLLAGLLMAAVCVPAHAWEFAMTGNFQWNYDYVSQAGTNGFFGPQNVATGALLGTGTNWAIPNFWAGSRLISGTQLGLVTGLDASYQYQRMVMNPEIRVNPAIRIRGQYWIGGFQSYNGGTTGYDAGAGTATGNALGSNTDLGSSLYLNQQTGSALTRPISTGQWNLLWATAQSPWGIIVVGKRPAPFGMGLDSDGEHTVVSESLAIVAPYGPLRIGIGVYPWRQGVFLDSQRNLVGHQIPAVGGGVANTTGTAYPKLWDQSNIRLQLPQASWFVTYSNGPLDAGIIYLYWQQHQGPESAGTLAASVASSQLFRPTIDSVIEGGVAYVKYNNGRFFFNAELDWDRWDNRFIQPLAPIGSNLPAGFGSPYQPVFNEDWSVATEFGFLCGPSKTSFLYAYIAGPDRRQGIWISKNSWNNIAFGNVPCNYALFLPYSYLMTYTYASGLNFRNSLGEGGLTDASVVATRLDYAVAANLNWYGSFIWAWRNGGWPWGVLTIDQGSAGLGGGINGLNAVQVFGINVQGGPAPQNGGPAGFAPNIPDNNLGYELTTGVDWKLLEGLTMNLRGAYWQPGEWFKFACIDRSVATATLAAFAAPYATLPNGHNALAPVGGGTFGTNPGKSIDPIWAFNGQLNVDF